MRSEKVLNRELSRVGMYLQLYCDMSFRVKPCGVEESDDSSVLRQSSHH